MRIFLAAALLALAAPAVLVGARSPYSDASCRSSRVAWTNDRCAGAQWGLTAIKAPEAWRTTRGAGVAVAVVDTGADFRHPDLRAHLLRRPGSNMLANTASRCPFQAPVPGARRSRKIAQDDNGHGTHVSGIVSAVTGNRIGVAGVAPDARVLPVKVLDRNGSGNDRDVARGICFAVRHGAKVINLSLGNDPVSSIVVAGNGSDTNRAIAFAYSRGAAVIIAAGNDAFPACDFPASNTKALCVGAIDRRGLKATYSNFGLAIGVVAPGGAASLACDNEDVWSTVLASRKQDCGQDGYEPFAGTSMATPHVSGAAALVIAQLGRKRATPKAVYDRLKSTADDLGVPGPDPFFGYGRVDAQRAVGR
ncbi:MAG TPA: S8 family serine peptidase [Gaiellaceae bacterium]|nr:S8 family serine peptidase [Gaiellaceae bacterium]